jgi:hypothetical protein
MMNPGTALKFSLCLLCSILFSRTLQAQSPNTLASVVQQSLSTQEATNYDLFTSSSKHDIAVDGEINNVIYLKLNKVALSTLKNAASPLISFT